MKTKHFRPPRSRLAAILIAAAMAVSLVGCGVDITSVGLPPNESLEKGDTVQMEVDFGTENQAEAEAIAKAAEKLDLTWTSSDEAVATVDEDGLVTAVGPGTAEITVSVADGNISSTCLVTVTVTATDVTVPETLELVTNGENTANLNAKATPEDATGITVTYESSDPSIVTVDETGLVTAVANGEADITTTLTQVNDMATGETATAENSTQTEPLVLTATTHVVVTTKVEAITLENTEGILTVGNTHKINASVTPENATDLTVTWTSSDNNIATVDADGNVKAVAVGNATITASAGNVSAEYALTVNNITCSYCGGTGHTSSNCSVKAADQKAAAQAAAQKQAAAQAAQQQQAAAQQPAANPNNNTGGGSTAPAPAPSTDNSSGSTSNPAPSGDSGNSGGGSNNVYGTVVDPNATQGSGTDWTQDTSNGDDQTLGTKG